MRRSVAGATTALVLLVAACSSRSHSGSPATTLAKRGHLIVTSSAFADGQPIPAKYTCVGDNVPPPLHWSGAPTAQQMIIAVTDPDAPGGTFVHWVHKGIAAAADGDVPPAGDYHGPCPPPGSGPHHYHFEVFAMYQDPSGSGSSFRVVEELRDWAVASGELVGTFQR